MERVLGNLDRKCTEFVDTCKTWAHKVPGSSILACSHERVANIRFCSAMTAAAVFLATPVSSIAVLATAFFLTIAALSPDIKEKLGWSLILGTTKLVCSLLNPIALLSLAAIGVAGSILCRPMPSQD